MAPILSRNQRRFARELVRQTGLDPSLVGAWLISEQPAGASHPVGHQDQNWLNIGLTDTRWYDGASSWKNPKQAARRSAAWLQGKQAVPGFGRAAPGIVNFSQTAGKPLQQQVAALQKSGWASSGYPNLPGVVSQNAGKYGINVRGGAPVSPSGTSQRQPATYGVQTRSSFDGQGFDTARRQYVLGQILQRVRSPFNPDRRSSLANFLPQQPPERADYTTAVSSLKRMAGGLNVQEPNAPKARSQVQGNARGALAFAAGRLGVSETAGTNRGPKIDDWQRSFGMLAQPWCGIFVGKALQQAGVKGVDSRIASTAAIVDMARQGEGGFAGLVDRKGARAGDVPVWDPGPNGHTGIVEKVRKDGSVVVIEGNSSNSVRRVVHKNRPAYYARPAYQ